MEWYRVESQPMHPSDPASGGTVEEGWEWCNGAVHESGFTVIPRAPQITEKVLRTYTGFSLAVKYSILRAIFD